MSATGRSDVRVALDVYPTPSWCVHRLLQDVVLPGGHWCEPAAGDGAIIRAVNEVRSVAWSAIEIRPECRENLLGLGASVRIEDALETPWNLRQEPIDLVITNPPYALAEAFLEKAMHETRGAIALLLRLDFLGSERRAPFFHLYPPDVFVLPNRPSFVRGQSDHSEYGWFVWRGERHRPHGRLAVLQTTPRDVRIPRIRKEVAHASP